MISRRALGIFALTAVVLAAISFAVVDVSIANANGCLGVSGPCADTSMPFVATIFASIGIVALLASVLPAINWFVGALQHQHDDDEFESMRAGSPAYAFESFEEEDA